MTSAFRPIGFALFGLSLLAPCAPALAQSAAPSTADQTELQAIAETDLAPLKEKAQAAIDLAASDPDQACELAKTTIGLASDAQQRFGAVYTKMTGEGVDVASLAGMKANLDAPPGKMTQLANSICSGQFAATQNDPARKDMTQVSVYVKSYPDDIVAADAAADRGDGTTACHLAGDAGHQLDDLSGYVADLRKRPTLAAGDRKALNELDTQIASFKTVNDNRLKACAAARQ
jgi:hypothetical protein